MASVKLAPSDQLAMTAEVLFRAWDVIYPRVLGGIASPAERAFAAIWLLEAEINNGGFSQYMFNSTGDDAAVARSALEQLGAHGTLAVFDEFLSLLPGGRAEETQDARQAQLDALAAERGEAELEEILDDLGGRFYATEDDLLERLYAFTMAKGLATQ